MELANIVARLNDLQSRVFDENRRLNRDERAEWRSLVRAVFAGGYVLKRKRIRNQMGWTVKVVWRVERRPVEKAPVSTDGFVLTDVRPNDGRRTLKGDCTTRAMTFALKESYRDIEREQYALADRENAAISLTGVRVGRLHRNSSSLWPKLMYSRGWERITLVRTITRGNVGRLVKGRIHAPILAVSSGHVAVVDENGDTRDTWDSRGGRVRYVIVRRDDMGAVSAALGGFAARG